MEINNIYLGDSRKLVKQLKDTSLDLIVTSPPYWDIHKYSENKLEGGYDQTLKDYINDLALIINSCIPKLKETGSVFINIMDVFRNKKLVRISDLLIDKIKIPLIERVVWYINNKMPVIQDRFLVNKMEWVLHFSKAENYKFYPDRLRLPRSEYAKKDKRLWKYNALGSLLGNVWSIPAIHNPYSIHPAMFPEELPTKIILGWSDKEDLILDPFLGSGTTIISCLKLNRKYLGFELSEKYYNLSLKRINTEKDQLKLF